MTDFEDAAVEDYEESAEEKLVEVAARAQLLAAMLEKTIDALRLSEPTTAEDAHWLHVKTNVQKHWNAAAFAVNDLCSAYDALAETTRR